MKEPKINIKVESGTVWNVYANISDLDAAVLNYDCYDDFNNDQREEEIISYTDEQREKGNTAVDFVEVY